MYLMESSLYQALLMAKCWFGQVPVARNQLKHIPELFTVLRIVKMGQISGLVAIVAL